MKLLEFLKVTEAKFKKPEIMYHGTSSANLQSILSNGVIPNPRDKVWGKIDHQLDTHSFSTASLQGSYWTDNLQLALSSAGRAKRVGYEFNKLLVIAQIAKQSAFSDEDNYISDIFRAMADAYRDIFGRSSPLTGEATMKGIALSYFTDSYKSSNTSSDKEAWVKSFGTNLHKEISENPDKQPINWSLMKALFETILLRTLIHEKRHASKWMKDKWVEEFERVHGEITTTVVEIEEKLHNLREKLTRVYRGSARRDGGFMNTLRINEPITYKGANRILTVLEIDKVHVNTTPEERRLPYQTILKGHYVYKIPDLFIMDWKKHMGPFPGIENPKTGEYIKEPMNRD